MVPAVILTALFNQPTEVPFAILGHLDERRYRRKAGLTFCQLACVVRRGATNPASSSPRYRILWYDITYHRTLALDAQRVQGANVGSGGRLLVPWGPCGILDINTDLEDISSLSSYSSSKSGL